MSHIPGGPDMDTVYRLTIEIYRRADAGSYHPTDAEKKEYQEAFDRLVAQGFTGDQIDVECERRYRTERVNKALRSVRL